MYKLGDYEFAEEQAYNLHLFHRACILLIKSLAQFAQCHQDSIASSINLYIEGIGVIR